MFARAPNAIGVEAASGTARYVSIVLSILWSIAFTVYKPNRFQEIPQCSSTLSLMGYAHSNKISVENSHIFSENYRMLGASGPPGILQQAVYSRHPISEQDQDMDCCPILLLWPERNLVDVTGFEPATPCLQSRCSPS